MSAEGGIRFDRYRFHPTQGLTRGRQEVRVTPKSLAVLHALLARMGEIVSRDELFRAVWPDTAVSEAALSTCIQELRRALSDDARQPKFIETVHRRGFRFLLGSSLDEPPAFERAPNLIVSRALGPIVGRDAALGQMSLALARVRDGHRQVIVITGEPGIGKTALVDTFLTSLDDRSACRVARADCVEHHGAGEAYQPLLEALTRLCTQPGGESCLTALRRCAPTWLAQLPALQTHVQRQVLQQRTAGATPQRMLRELTDALETMTRRSAIVLCLEDLQWSDISTLEWIASFARRPDGARVLVIGTYRPGEAGGRAHSPDALTSDLHVKGLCVEIALPRLDARAVSEYVVARFPPAAGAGPSLEKLATLVYQRTEGNPLFVVTALTNLMAQRVVVARDDRWAATDAVDAMSLAIPADVQRAIERHLDRLDDHERGLLEVASVIGRSCSAASVAAGASISASEVETTLGSLSRRNAFVREGPPVEWPDGTLSATFEFLHSLYREVLSARLSPSRRVDLHRAIAARLEAAYGARATELAAELAFHFEHGRDFHRAVAYLQHAAEIDRDRSAHVVAQRQYRHALALLEKLPAGDGRDEREVALRTGLGHVVMQTDGWGASEVEAAYARVRELAEARGPSQPLLSALWNLWIFSTTRGDLQQARALADRLFALAGQTGEPASLLQAHHARWSTQFALGDFKGTTFHAREGLRLCETRTQGTLAYGSHDAGICARLFAARVLALGGQTDTAAALCADALTLARALDHPFTLAFALMHVAAVHETRRDAAAVRTYAAEARHLALEHGLGLMLAWATCFLGWSMVHLGDARNGLTMLGEGVASARATGSVLFQPHMLGLLAGAQAASDLVADAMQTVDEAFAISERTGERFYIAELHRLRGELRLAHDDGAHSHRLAAGDFETAMRLADSQGAHQLALRAAVSLGRIWRRAGKMAEAGRVLFDARGRLREGADLPDVMEVNALISARATS